MGDCGTRLDLLGGRLPGTPGTPAWDCLPRAISVCVCKIVVWAQCAPSVRPVCAGSVRTVWCRGHAPQLSCAAVCCRVLPCACPGLVSLCGPCLPGPRVPVWPVPRACRACRAPCLRLPCCFFSHPLCLLCRVRSFLKCVLSTNTKHKPKEKHVQSTLVFFVFVLVLVLVLVFVSCSFSKDRNFLGIDLQCGQQGSLNLCGDGRVLVTDV